MLIHLVYAGDVVDGLPRQALLDHVPRVGDSLLVHGVAFEVKHMVTVISSATGGAPDPQKGTVQVTLADPRRAG